MIADQLGKGVVIIVDQNPTRSASLSGTPEVYTFGEGSSLRTSNLQTRR